MGFDFACATSFDNPVISIDRKDKNFYYAVDHVPTLAWQDASGHLSEQLLPILNGFLLNKFDLKLQEVLKRATETQDGKIVNSTIIKYQKKLGKLIQ